MSIGEAIKEYINERGLKQTVVARQAGIRPDSFCMMVNDKRKIEVEEYVRICNALNEPIERFVKMSEASNNRPT